MPWNGTGTYNLPPAYSPEVNGTTIDANRYNGLTGDVAAGVTAALAKNGENAATANLPMGGFKHTGAGSGTGAGQYLSWGTAAIVTSLAASAAVTVQYNGPILSLASNDATACVIVLQKSATWNYRIEADVTSFRIGTAGFMSAGMTMLTTSGYTTFGSRVGINGKTPVANVAAPAVATDLATALTLVNDIRTRLINFGIYT